ncbi:hypothetical protein [Phenylobacterium sp.]|uniref:hypothetical protein n=1 Tax=Phenylobacterium sp. TaxID=1871053 RepID=UPI002BEF4B5B|nr:hypothetical protein [Phenylobacterium sp.]HLZ77109.1 hypothetical protein [Phenylobacterium sp.]
MPSAHVWTGQEVRRLARFRDLLHSASALVGRDDHLANRMLEDALEELHGVLGDRAQPIAELDREAH